MASAALARDLCIQVDSGSYAGSQLVFKKARVTRRSVAPAQGYLASYSPGVNSFTSFTPLYGQSVVNTAGSMAIGVTFQSAQVGPGSSGSGSSPPQWISMDCSPGADGRVDVPDPCNAYISGASVNAHVVDCIPEARIP